MGRLSDALAALRPLAEVEVDEAMAQARAQATSLTSEVAEAGGGLFGLPLWSIVLLSLIVIGVGAMLLIIAGHQRREREASEAHDGPLFGDQYAVDDDEAPVHDDRFAEVRIEGVPRDTLPARPDPVPDEAEENVVPLRAVGQDYEPEPEPERATMQRREPVRPVEVTPVMTPEPGRYAFAGQALPDMPRFGGAQDRLRDVPREPAIPEGARGWGGEQDREMRDERDRDAPRGAPRAESDDAPFIAPYIRDDIERSERRQAERIGELRDEVSRQFQSLKNENASRLDLFVGTVERKLDAVSNQGGRTDEQDFRRAAESALRPLADRVSELALRVATQDDRLSDIAELLERRLAGLPDMDAHIRQAADGLRGLGEDLRGTRGELTGEVSGLRQSMERIERAVLERAREDGSASVALTEVVRGTLPEGSYAFARSLSNGETADCVIAFDGLRERIAIDAGFPMKAFDELPSRDAVRRNLPQAKAAEDAFRRAVLRAILEAADRCIVPQETADSCLLFLPSEAAYTILHDRFGDLVRDAQRARVWLTSPSTLMGTLALLRNLMPPDGQAPAERSRTETAEDDARARERRAEQGRRARERASLQDEEQQALREEIKALRERAGSLAGELDRTRGTLADLIGTTGKLAGGKPGGAEPGEPESYRFAGADWAEDDRRDPFDD